MPESRKPLSAVEVLGQVSKSLRRIEGELSTVAQIVERMVQHLQNAAESRRQGEPVSGKGSEPVAAPGAS